MAVCGGWADSSEMAIDLYNLLERHHPGVKWTMDNMSAKEAADAFNQKNPIKTFECGWTEQLGFKDEYNPVKKKTKPDGGEAHRQPGEVFLSSDLG
eukprot:5948322-Prymnesium_polylepis.1